MTTPRRSFTASEAYEWLAEHARTEGFEALGAADARKPGPEGARLQEFLAAGYHGDMEWLADTAERRSAPLHLWPEARSVVMFGANHAPPADPLPELAERERGYVAIYARGRDYHEILKGRLKRIAQKFAARHKAAVKVFVDTAPLLEKPWAARAGIGWQGKHTNLVSRDWGSWLFLGAMLTDIELPFAEPAPEHCGACTACLDICPTRAFPAPFQLDARRCISFLTIEHKGLAPRELRPLMGSRIFGCDDCLAVCPWNKFARHAAEIRFHTRFSQQDFDLAALIGLDDAGFRAMFTASPVKRLGLARFRRNVLVAIGNSGRGDWAGLAVQKLDSGEAIVRAAAIWALGRLDRDIFLVERSRRMAGEADPLPLEEWRHPPWLDSRAEDPDSAPSGSV